MSREPPSSEELTVENIRACVIGSMDSFVDGMAKRDFAVAKWGVDQLLAMLDVLIGETEKKRLMDRWDATWADRGAAEWFMAKMASLGERRRKEKLS